MSGGLEAVLDQIDQAGLSATAFRTAVRLLRLAQANDGQVRLSRSQAIEVCGSDSDATMRTHLYQIAKAGIVEYHAAGDVFVRFLWWPVRAQRANEVLIEDTLRAQRASEPEIEPSDDDLRAQRASKPSEMRAERANDDLLALGLRAQRVNLRAERANGASTSHAYARGRRLGGRSISTTDPKEEPTYLPKSSQVGDGRPLTPPQQMAFDLLIDEEVGIFRLVADQIVRKLPLPDIYHAVDQWLPDPVAGPGALAERLKLLQPSHRQTVKLSNNFVSSDLFARHRLPDELLAGEERRKYSEVTLPDDAARRRQYRNE